jgi:hypothetical protein
LVGVQDRVGERVRRACADLRGRLDAVIGHNPLDHFQSFFDALHVSAILRGAFSGLLGDQSAHFLFVLKPPPEPDPIIARIAIPKTAIINSVS